MKLIFFWKIVRRLIAFGSEACALLRSISTRLRVNAISLTRLRRSESRLSGTGASHQAASTGFDTKALLVAQDGEASEVSRNSSLGFALLCPVLLRLRGNAYRGLRAAGGFEE